MPSTVISFMSYSADTSVLRITFVSGLVYHYKNVPVEIYNRLRTAKSKGTYFNEHIKNKFDFEKVE